MEFIKPYTSLIENRLRDLKLPDSPETLYDPQRYILSSGGKRVRPVLALMACGICGKNPKQAIPAGLAIELIHNFTLIHDDIMDQADSRRGKESVHKKWDLATGILSGDGMFVQACLQLQGLPDDADQKKAYKLFFEGINSVCEGQALDMEFEQRDTVSVDEYLVMISGKTSALLSVSLELGGISAGADEKQCAILRRIGESLGLAFQIQDDLLDVVGNPETFGKKRGGDIYEGKKTFLAVTTLECCSDGEKEWLKSCLSKKGGTAEMVDMVIELYYRHGIIEKAEQAMNNYYEKAEKDLQQFEDSRYKEDLNHLITFLKKREI